MKTYYQLLLLICVFGLFSFHQPKGEIENTQKNSIPDKVVIYKTIDNIDLKLHFFYPPNHKVTDNTTALLFFHGGGWNGGAPSQLYAQSAYLASRGLVVVSAQYRVNKANGTSPQECVKDGKSAMRWLRTHATDYGINADKILAGGGSAGGHVAAALATVKGFNEVGEDTTVSCIPEALVLFNPAIHNGKEGYGYTRVQEYWESFSPYHNIDKTTPPTVILLGTEDRVFKPALAKEFKKNMEENGVRCDLILYQDQEHAFFNKDMNLEMHYQTMIDADKFLISLGYLKGEPRTLTSFLAEHKEENALRLWYDKPAKDWQSEALPIGNGYMGAMFFGGTNKEQIQFSEGTLWSGGAGSNDNYNFGVRKDAWKHLDAVRKLLDEGKFDEAHTLAQKELTGVLHKSENDLSSFGDYGAQQTMGDWMITVDHAEEVENYKRVLDIEKAEGYITYNIGDNQYKRTYFGDYPSKLMVYKLESDLPENYSISFQTPHQKNKETFKKNLYSFQGEVKDNGMQFETCLKIESDGKTKFVDNKITIENATYVVAYHVASTEYLNKFPTYKGNDFITENKHVLHRLKEKSFEEIQKEHRLDYQNLYERVDFDLGYKQGEEIPTDQRLLAYSKGNNDYWLEQLYFQFSRYLMISSSRPGTMPMHLQGKWNNSTNPAWACDYHMNINQQMLYWPAEVVNLSECEEPLNDYIESLVEPGKITAKEFFNARGWTVSTMNNPFGYTSSGWGFPWGFFPGGAGWISQHLWEHYEFTQDEAFLKNQAYPIMKEAALFWVDYLTENENGLLVSTPSYSPEHGGISKGAAMDHQIAWDLMSNCIAACEVLETDADFKKEIIAVRNKIASPTIGSWGQLQEWMEDVDDPNNKHRHVSHLYALHPGKQISLEKTPEWAEATRVSLNARGDNGTGWSLAWKVNFWSRLKDGDRAYKLYRRLLQPIGFGDESTHASGTYANLFCGHPPFQLDGNMGGAAGMAEMLLQSQTGTLEILPALPQAWKKGNIKGLKARGGYTVDMSWKNGKLKTLSITAIKNGPCTLLYNGKKIVKDLVAGETVEVKF
ncbi:glycosyl hydrolase family 95 catalytic domain-containing protein [Flammeovirga kamogawensis]|uniref:Glycoside hydrolase N-terminal domain-containing protein n=1 Tax=Flammeovirga kamogawensis TaxID=373891 RepID=A0ABX8H3Q1_9BACT|nr:glycoside hydrolase N-terminal domain-containing protein [Flammeovirga kamogawensis]MBB6460492.1 alpha-L-fucosidase 2 [Flammeovirga kamogawensis]QWG10298.1 glycoside hydrolase N-terminal domain-containing protein [Flammeovirga kamogawensis]TRX64746.1 carboxylesterase family protein [Flammeovirga kamogawensis]